MKCYALGTVYWNATNFLISFIFWRGETIVDFKFYCKVLYIIFLMRFLLSILQFIRSTL